MGPIRRMGRLVQSGAARAGMGQPGTHGTDGTLGPWNFRIPARDGKRSKPRPTVYLKILQKPLHQASHQTSERSEAE